MFVNISSISDISRTSTYRLVGSSSYLSLAIDPDEADLQLRANGRSDTPLEFQFRTSDELGKFNICAAVGNATFCLDAFYEPKDVPHLSPWNYYSGQYWTVEPSSDGIKLSNDWTGPDWFLDINQTSSQAHMTTGDDYPAQFWMLDQVAENVTLPPDAPDIDTPTTLSTDSGGSSSSSSNSNRILSIPAIVGISAAGGILSAVLVLVALMLLFRRRYRRPQHPQQAASAAIDTESSPPITPAPRNPDSDSSSTTPPGPPSPQQPQYPPQELETQPAHRHSIYELPATADPDSSTNLLHPSTPEKNQGVFDAASVPLRRAPSTAVARWEEVVPDGDGEIVFANAFLSARRGEAVGKEEGELPGYVER